MLRTRRGAIAQKESGGVPVAQAACGRGEDAAEKGDMGRRWGPGSMGRDGKRRIETSRNIYSSFVYSSYVCSRTNAELR